MGLISIFYIFGEYQDRDCRAESSALQEVVLADQKMVNAT